MGGLRRRIAALCVAALSLAALTVVRGGGGGPPLYDGLCTPPNYALLGATPGPGSASATYAVSDLASTQELATPESAAPQAQMIIGAGTLASAPGAATVTVTITPVKPPATRPNGTVEGNVYDFAATSGGQTVSEAPGHPVTIVLEATATGGPTLTLEHYDGSRWTALKTFQSGCGSTFAAATPSLGLFALVAQGGSTSPGTSGTKGGGSGAPVLVIILAVLGFLALAIVAARISRRRQLS